MSNEKTTEKKNQHYVPKFYLRNFSINNNLRQIGIYNLNNKKYIPSGSIADQAYKKYYYGKDGELEDYLSYTEAIESKTIKEVITKEMPPKFRSQDHRNLLFFAVITELRNPIERRRLESMTDTLWNEVFKHHDAFKNIDTTNLHIRLTDPVALALNNIPKLVLVLHDLRLKLLINETDKPFVTSDNPIAKYNQFLEFNTNSISTAGYLSKGLEIFIPINDRLMLMFYDEMVYYVGRKKGHIVRITSNSEIDLLNILQYVNASSNIYGSERMSESYARYLHEKANKFKKANEIITEKGKNDSDNYYLLQRIRSIQTRLSLSFVFKTTHADRFQFDGSLVHGRPFALAMKEFFEEKEREMANRKINPV